MTHMFLGQATCASAGRPHRTLVWSVSVLVCIGVVAGCSSRTAGYPPLGEVSGVVTMGTTPLANATVMFQPPVGRASIGDTDAEGRYRLVFTSAAFGAIVGPHHVSVEPKMGVEQPRGKGLTTVVECEAEVAAGANQIDLVIENGMLSARPR